MIASDDNNPQFMGAHDPDARLIVRFYVKAVPNPFETEKQGKPIFYDADFVQIKLPGNQLNDVDDFVNESHKRRFPKHWAHFQNNRTTEQVIGVPIGEWSIVSKSMAEELRAIGFKTVESVALAGDHQLQTIGMRAGMQPHSFRERAQQYLKRAEGEAAAHADAERIKAMETKDAAQQEQMRVMQEQIAELLANQRAKPGPKPKETAAA